jgi:small nuclear ribonucleoprotein (snRNP)-like protein
MILSAAQRRFFSEVGTLMDKHVKATTTDGLSYSGTLTGINPDNMSMILSKAKDEKGQVFHKIILNGNVVAKLFASEKPFDLRALGERLEKVFPTMVRTYEDKGFIWVMEKIKVTEKGVTEGTGPAAERVQRVFTQFLSDMKT